MNGSQGSSDTPLVPMADLGSLSVDDYTDYCADLAEQVESGTMTWDQAADLMFGNEPDVTYTRWSA